VTRWHVAALVAAVAVLSSAAPDAQQAPRFRSGTDAVRVDVRVTRGAVPVVGLTAEQFELRDSGVRQMIEAAALEDVPVGLLLALDVSGSVRGQALADLKQAARVAVAALGPDDRALVLTFSDRIILRVPWTADRGRLEAAIEGIDAGGATALYDALSAAIALSGRALGRTLLLVLTDGRDTASWLDARALVDAVQRSDLAVYVVSPPTRRPVPSTRSGPDRTAERVAWTRLFHADPSLFPDAFLEIVTADSGGDLLRAAATADLPRVFARVVADFKSRYVLTYSPRGVPEGGWHPIEVKLRGVSGTVTARRGYSR
jgi:VWFA-related protein